MTSPLVSRSRVFGVAYAMGFGCVCAAFVLAEIEKRYRTTESRQATTGAASADEDTTDDESEDADAEVEPWHEQSDNEPKPATTPVSGDAGKVGVKPPRNASRGRRAVRWEGEDEEKKE